MPLLIYLFHIQVHKIAYMRIPYVVWFVTQPVAHLVSSVRHPYVCHGDLTSVQLCYVQFMDEVYELHREGSVDTS